MVDYRLAYQTRINALEQQLNQRLTREQAKAFGIDQAVTSQLVAGAVLDQSAREMGLGVSDEQLIKLIASDPTFKDSSGAFSRERLIAALRSIGMSEDDYVRNQHAVAMRNQLVNGLGAGHVRAGRVSLRRVAIPVGAARVRIRDGRPLGGADPA